MANAPSTPTTMSDVDIQVNLPELPPVLKHLSPYIQRAIELKKKDPIMCYWCLYFTAKQGVAAKGGKETRPFLFAVLELLEKTKSTLASISDAVASDDAGSAYIESFALKLFNMADNEDRKSRATKSTAKKFLAAANFLELLSVFEVPDQTENEAKIRYSKWKAADIAKAIREGRQPTPGPASNGPTFGEFPSVPSGAQSPAPSAPAAESMFGSIPPSISTSPTRTPGSPIGVKRPLDEVEPDSDASGSRNRNGKSASKAGANGKADDTTPHGSPRRVGKKALSPERSSGSPVPGTSATASLGAAMTRGASRSRSPPLTSSKPRSKEGSPSSGTFSFRGAGSGTPPPIPAVTSSSSPSASPSPAPASSNLAPSSSSPPTTSASKTAPQTPISIKTGLAPGSLLKPGASPGAWSTIATPGAEDGYKKTMPTPPASGRIGGFLSKLYSAASGSGNAGDAKSGYIVEEPMEEDLEDPDMPSAARSGSPVRRLPPIHPSSLANITRGDSGSTVASGSGVTSRQESWSSTMANRGDPMSRSGSLSVLASPNYTGEEDDASEVVGDASAVKPVGKTGGVGVGPSIGNGHANGSSNLSISTLPPEISAPEHSNNPEEADDILAPLPSSGKRGSNSFGTPASGTSSLSVPKKVHFTPSVIGGLSSIASDSPPPSPSGTIRTFNTAGTGTGTSTISGHSLRGGPDSSPLGSRVPLPPSDEEDEAASVDDQTAPGMVVHQSAPRTPRDTAPAEEYRVPQFSVSPSSPLASAGRSSPPLTPAGANGSLPVPHLGEVASGSNGGTSSPGSLSPRLRATVVPPISATVAASSSGHHKTGSSGSGGSGSGPGMIPGLPPSTGPAAPAFPILPSAPPPSLPFNLPSTPSSRPNNGFSLPPPPSFPPSTGPPPSLPSLPLLPPPPPPPPKPPLPETLEPEETNKAKKHARYAISALDFDDLDTARKELIIALGMLGIKVVDERL